MRKILVIALVCGIGGCSKQDEPDNKQRAQPGTARGKLATAKTYLHVDEAAKSARASVGRTMRIQGFVGMGSVARRIAGGRAETQFDLEYKGANVRVEYRGPLPDAFDADGGSQVVVTGKFEARGKQVVFVASELLTKCPDKYEGVKKR